MKRKIIISLLSLFMSFTICIIVTVFYVSNTATVLNDIINLHQVEELRRSFIISIQSVQNNVHTIHTPFETKLDVIVNNMATLNKISRQCASCHHRNKVSERIVSLQEMVNDYESSLSYFITTRANEKRVHDLKMAVAKVGDELLELTEEMSHSASAQLAERTLQAILEVKDVKKILFVTLIVTFLLGVLVSIRLTNSITRPVSKLVEATGLISSGKFGSLLTYRDKTEFGELAMHFNNMSTAIRDSYDQLQSEIKERKMTEEALMKSERFLSMTFESIRDPFCIFDSDFKIVKANKAYADLKEQSLDDLYGMRCYKVLKGTDSKCENCIVDATFRSKDPCAKDKLITMVDGSEIWLDIYTYPIYDDDGNVAYVMEYFRDISERKQAEKNLRESQERYALAAQGAHDGLWDWDLKTDSVFYSPRWKDMLGISGHEVQAMPAEWLKRIHPDDREMVESALHNHLNGEVEHFEAEHRIVHENGVYIWVQMRGVAVRDASGKPYRIAGSMTNITKRKEAERQLTFDALHDALTGLPNRSLFMDRLYHASSRERRNQHYLFAVLFLDLDSFKVLNDSMGHAAGDEMLIEVAQRLSDCLRLGDTVARLGGDEFAILLEDLANKKEALQIAERIKEKLSLPFNIQNQEIFSSGSIGIVFSSTEYDKPEHLLRNADIAMYHAKLNKTAGYEVFTREMYADTVARLRMENDLKQALENNEFKLQYLPVVSAVSGRIVGLEALVRWNHPVHGMLYPDKFVSTAEDAGIIAYLGEWVLREACQQLSHWHSQFPSLPDLTISVNISIKQLLPVLVEKIKTILGETKLHPHHLILEITESMLMESPELVFPLLSQLKALGIKLHIDDFGTGYSSLSYLHNLPFDVLKIDSSIISRLSDQAGDLVILRTISELARNLNMELIAEGVESEYQFHKLKSLNCNFMQGYFFSKPLDKEEVGKILKRGEYNVNYKLEHAAVAG